MNPQDGRFSSYAGNACEDRPGHHSDDESSQQPDSDQRDL